MAAGRPVEAESSVKGRDWTGSGFRRRPLFARRALRARTSAYAEAINETTTAFSSAEQSDQALKIKAHLRKSRATRRPGRWRLREQLNYLLNQREKHFVSAFDIAAQYAKLGDRQHKSRVAPNSLPAARCFPAEPEARGRITCLLSRKMRRSSRRFLARPSLPHNKDFFAQ